MQQLFDSFEADLNDVLNATQAIELASKLPETRVPQIIETCEDDYCTDVKSLNVKLIEARQGLVKVPGVFKLYIAGIFEAYIKTLVEEMAVAIAQMANSYSQIPKSLRLALIKDTAKVIPDPRRYGHGDGAVESFIKNLHMNIHEDDLSSINYQCITITESNMRPEILSELFKKVSVTKVWEEVGGQVQVKTHFSTTNSQDAQRKAMDYLENFMRQRNDIAHVSTSVTWPSTSSVIDDVEYFKALGKVLVDICTMKKASLQQEFSTQNN